MLPGASEAKQDGASSEVAVLRALFEAHYVEAAAAASLAQTPPNAVAAWSEVGVQ
jgi:hypothetical protein